MDSSPVTAHDLLLLGDELGDIKNRLETIKKNGSIEIGVDTNQAISDALMAVTTAEKNLVYRVGVACRREHESKPRSIPVPTTLDEWLRESKRVPQS